jgi:hypothetical protein
MPPRQQKASTPSWIPIAWTVGAGLLGFVFSGGAFYATTAGTLDRHNSAIDRLTNVLKEESQARVAMEKAEAAKRDELRKEYLGMMKDQTSTFSNMSEKLVTIGTTVAVINTRYEQLNDSLKKVLDQTAPTHRGRTP